MEEKKVNLDAPAFGVGADKADTSETTTEISQIKELGQDDAELVTRKDEEEVSDEEQKVPYSRFKTIADQKREAEERAIEASERYERLLAQRETVQQDVERPVDSVILESFIKLYGDNENTRKAAEIETQRIAYIEQRAEQKARETYEEVRTNEVKSLARNESVIDNNLQDLQDYVGRKLTEEEQVGILEVVDEYTPKDADGNYSGDLLPFDKAMEIYELKNQSKGQASKRARSTVTRLTSGSSDGEPSGAEKVNKDYNPMDWNAYRRRI